MTTVDRNLSLRLRSGLLLCCHLMMSWKFTLVFWVLDHGGDLLARPRASFLVSSPLKNWDTQISRHPSLLYPEKRVKMIKRLDLQIVLVFCFLNSYSGEWIKSSEGEATNVINRLILKYGCFKPSAWQVSGCYNAELRTLSRKTNLCFSRWLIMNCCFL